MKEKYNYIIYKISDGVAEIKLNRTEVLNSFNYEMADELIKSFEDCKVNNKVSAVYDDETKQLVFQLNISDFIFPKPLMQEHFNESYLESDKFPKASFSGIIEEKNESIVATGTLKIHGESNKVEVTGSLEKTKNNVIINATFVIELTDYKIKIPKVVMYNIAEEIEVTVNAELKKI